MTDRNHSLTRGPDSEENNHPRWGRITSLWSLPSNEVTQYLNGTLHTQNENEKKKKENAIGHRIKMWAILDGEIIERRSIVELSLAINISAKTISNKKTEYIKSGKDEFCILGTRIGWGKPPKDAA